MIRQRGPHRLQSYPVLLVRCVVIKSFLLYQSMDWLWGKILKHLHTLTKRRMHIKGEIQTVEIHKIKYLLDTVQCEYYISCKAKMCWKDKLKVEVHLALNILRLNLKCLVYQLTYCWWYQWYFWGWWVSVHVVVFTGCNNCYLKWLGLSSDTNNIRVKEKQTMV